MPKLYVVWMVVGIKLLVRECVESMVQRWSHQRNVVLMSVRIERLMGECANDMERSWHGVASRGVISFHSGEEFVWRMGQRCRIDDAVLKIVTIMQSREDCVLSMGRKW